MRLCTSSFGLSSGSSSCSSSSAMIELCGERMSCDRNASTSSRARSASRNSLMSEKVTIQPLAKSSLASRRAQRASRLRSCGPVNSSAGREVAAPSGVAPAACASASCLIASQSGGGSCAVRPRRVAISAGTLWPRSSPDWRMPNRVAAARLAISTWPSRSVTRAASGKPSRVADTKRRSWRRRSAAPATARMRASTISPLATGAADSGSTRGSAASSLNSSPR